MTPKRYSRMNPRQRAILRGEYVEEQKGLCYYCKKPLDKVPDDISSKPINRRLFPPNFFVWPIHLHHCHKTDLTIGAVHAKCNAILWQYLGE
jgi:hypothetical protein